MSSGCQIFIDILIVFRRVMTFAYDVSFFVDTHELTLSILLRIVCVFLVFSLILNSDCEVYLITVFGIVCFAIVY